MNTYTFKFFVTCPLNGIRVLYDAKIENKEIIAVEEILAAIKTYESGFHEPIADDMFGLFGGRQTITADHHSVTITTTRP